MLNKTLNLPGELFDKSNRLPRELGLFIKYMIRNALLFRMLQKNSNLIVFFYYVLEQHISVFSHAHWKNSGYST